MDGMNFFKKRKANGWNELSKLNRKNLSAMEKREDIESNERT